MSDTPIPLADWQAQRRTLAFGDHSIAYWDTGQGSPLLLVHGYPSAAWDWSYVWTRLAQEHRLIAFDLLGFGFSDKPARGYSIHRQADLAEAVLRHLKIDRYDAVVHDYGVSVGQELLARVNRGSAAATLQSMQFLNGGLQPDLHRPRLLQKIGHSPLGWILGYLINRRRFGKAFSEVFGPDTQPTEDELDAFWQLIQFNGGQRRMHTLLHYIGDRNTHQQRWLEALQQASVPIQLINGALDPVSGRHLVEAMQIRVPGLKAVVLDDVGHYPHTEAPARVAEAITAFLSAGPRV